MGKITRSRLPFERIEVSKGDLMEMFSYNRFKMEIIEKKIGDRGTVYRCGSLVDLCSGPHIKHTGKIKAFKLTNVRLWWNILKLSLLMNESLLTIFSWAQIYHKMVPLNSVVCMVLHSRKVTV